MFCSEIMIQQGFNDFRVALGLLHKGQHLTSRKRVSLHQLPQVIGSIGVDGKGGNNTQLGIIRQDGVGISWRTMENTRIPTLLCELCVDVDAGCGFVLIHAQANCCFA